MGNGVVRAVAFVKRTFGNWMDDSGYNKADIADVVLPIAAAGSAVLTTVLWELAPTELGFASLAKAETLFAVASALAALILTLVSGKRSLTTRAEARGAMSSFSNSLSGAADAVSILMESERTLVDCNRFVESMLGEATSLMPISQCRATLYGLDEDERADGDSQYLKRIGRSKGRPDNARRQFTPDTPHGKAIIDIVMNGSPRYVRNHRAQEFHLDRDKESQWRSFCVIPISTTDGVWGALFLDSDKRNDFTSDKKNIAVSIARFIEIGIEMLVSAAEDVRPEISEAISQLGGDLQENVDRRGYAPIAGEGEQHGEGA